MAVDIVKIGTKYFQDMCIGGNRLATMGKNHLQVFNLDEGEHMADTLEDADSQFELEMQDTVTSIHLSKDGRYLLANMSFKNPRIELLDLNRREVVQRFRGHKQEMFILKCAFGGVNEAFVVCGSEDAALYLWNREKGDLVARIEGHTQVINAVHWCPSDPYLFASASDDQTIRLWGLEEMPGAEVNTDSKDIKRIDQAK